MDERDAAIKQLYEEKERSRPTTEDVAPLDSMPVGALPSLHIKPHQRAPTAKEELQKSKEHTIAESKLFLSKRGAELERKNTELAKTN